MQENTTVDGNRITITRCPNLWNNIRQKGEEAQSGNPILKKVPVLMLPHWICTVASVHDVPVFVFPTVGIFSTGDELRNPKEGGTLKPGKSGVPTQSIYR